MSAQAWTIQASFAGKARAFGRTTARRCQLSYSTAEALWQREERVQISGQAIRPLGQAIDNHNKTQGQCKGNSCYSRYLSRKKVALLRKASVSSVLQASNPCSTFPFHPPLPSSETGDEKPSAVKESVWGSCQTMPVFYYCTVQYKLEHAMQDSMLSSLG